MTKKHFIAIAKILKEGNAPQNLVAELAAYFASVNPDFDYPKFLKASVKE